VCARLMCAGDKGVRVDDDHPSAAFRQAPGKRLVFKLTRKPRRFGHIDGWGTERTWLGEPAITRL
jgi:hypothetical protein